MSRAGELGRDWRAHDREPGTSPAVSGLSCPVGFKNGTSGNVQIAIEAILSAGHPHNFLGHTKHGQTAIFVTKGNPDCHIILRGGRQTVNYDAAAVQSTCEQMEKAGIRPQVMIDCSHANSNKDHTRQSSGVPRCCRTNCRRRPSHHRRDDREQSGRRSAEVACPARSWSTDRASPTPASDGTKPWMRCGAGRGRSICAVRPGIASVPVAP